MFVENLTHPEHTDKDKSTQVVYTQEGMLLVLGDCLQVSYYNQLTDPK